MATPSVRRLAAERYRRMARTIIDRRAINALTELADEYEAQAASMEATADVPVSSATRPPETESRD